jgi:hypothetical protein
MSTSTFKNPSATSTASLLPVAPHIATFRDIVIRGAHRRLASTTTTTKIDPSCASVEAAALSSSRANFHDLDLSSLSTLGTGASVMAITTQPLPGSPQRTASSDFNKSSRHMAHNNNSSSRSSGGNHNISPTRWRRTPREDVVHANQRLPTDQLTRYASKADLSTATPPEALYGHVMMTSPSTRVLHAAASTAASSTDTFAEQARLTKSASSASFRAPKAPGAGKKHTQTSSFANSHTTAVARFGGAAAAVIRARSASPRPSSPPKRSPPSPQLSPKGFSLGNPSIPSTTTSKDRGVFFASPIPTVGQDPWAYRQPNLPATLLQPPSPAIGASVANPPLPLTISLVAPPSVLNLSAFGQPTPASDEAVAATATATLNKPGQVLGVSMSMPILPNPMMLPTPPTKVAPAPLPNTTHRVSTFNFVRTASPRSSVVAFGSSSSPQASTVMGDSSPSSNFASSLRRGSVTSLDSSPKLSSTSHRRASVASLDSSPKNASLRRGSVSSSPTLAPNSTTVAIPTVDETASHLRQAMKTLQLQMESILTAPVLFFTHHFHTSYTIVRLQRQPISNSTIDSFSRCTCSRPCLTHLDAHGITPPRLYSPHRSNVRRFHGLGSP